jgi:hypothetical protein
MENFKNLKKNILVVSNDAGGANQIYYFLKKKKINYRSYITGPAKKIFNNKNNINISNTNISIFDNIIFGSGSSDKEYIILQKAIKQKIHTIVFLDNWVNFYKRLKRSKNSLLPDEIWVSDNSAYRLANKFFKGKILIKLVNNYYLDFIKDKIKKKKLKKKYKTKVLFLSANYDSLRFKIKKKINKDFKLFEIFIKKKNIICGIIKKKIVKIDILPHPSEKKNKYDKLVKKYKHKINILKNKKLENIIFKYKFAVSTNSYALMVAKKVGLITFNNIRKVGIKKSIPTNYIDYTI